MDKDRVAGAARQAKGAIKEAAGKLTGDHQTEAAGKVEKKTGQAQGTVGKTKDTLRNVVR